MIAWDRDDDGKLSEGDVSLPFELTSRGYTGVSNCEPCLLGLVGRF